MKSALTIALLLTSLSFFGTSGIATAQNLSLPATGKFNFRQGIFATRVHYNSGSLQARRWDSWDRSAPGRQVLIGQALDGFIGVLPQILVTSTSQMDNGVPSEQDSVPPGGVANNDPNIGALENGSFDETLAAIQLGHENRMARLSTLNQSSQSLLDLYQNVGQPNGSGNGVGIDPVNGAIEFLPSGGQGAQILPMGDSEQPQVSQPSDQQFNANPSGVAQIVGQSVPGSPQMNVIGDSAAPPVPGNVSSPLTTNSVATSLTKAQSPLRDWLELISEVQNAMNGLEDSKSEKFKSLAALETKILNYPVDDSKGTFEECQKEFKHILEPASN